MPATKTLLHVIGVPVPAGVGLPPGVGLLPGVGLPPGATCLLGVRPAEPQTAEATEKSCTFLLAALYSPSALVVPSVNQIFPELSAASRWGLAVVVIDWIVMVPVVLGMK